MRLSVVLTAQCRRGIAAGVARRAQCRKARDNNAAPPPVSGEAANATGELRAICLARLLSVVAVSLMLAACSSEPSEETLAEIEELEGQVHQLETALRQANDNIRNANVYIATVQSAQYDGCEDLRYAVSSLTNVEEVSEP